jgi:hypothetical protein
VRRLLLVLVSIALFLIVPASAASASTPTGCVSAATATYKHTFDGPGGTASITAVEPLCSGQRQTFSLVSYTAASAGFAYPQFVYGVETATIDAKHRTVRLAVTVPGCYAQVDLIFGTGVLNEVLNTDTHYGSLKLGSPVGIGSRSVGPVAGYNGGASPCVTTPIVTYSNGCSGSFSATLANGSDANVDAVFIVAGHRIRVAPGTTTTVAAAKRGSLSIRDDTFTTHISTWQTPTTGCTTTPTTPSTAATTTSPAGATPSPTTTTTTAKSTPTATATLDPSPANGGLATASIEPGTTATALPTTGPGNGSLLIVGLGLLMVGIGVLVLIRLLQGLR